MIRYDITLEALLSKISQHNPTWLERAAKRAEKIDAQGAFTEKGSIWSQIKAVYMTIQHGKCIFCERQLEDIKLGLIEQDVEHFRPKRSVKKWRSTIDSIQPTPVPKSGGYYKLAYNVFNYAASCKPCNSILKKGIFPIVGTYHLDGNEPIDLNQIEKPLLIYPIGSIDSDPETLIQFNGVFPYAAANDDEQRLRALVTIELFKLNDPINRKNLIKERARIIVMLWSLLSSELDEAQAIVAAYLNDTSHPHTNCGRCFIRLYHSDNQQAETFFHLALALISTSS